MLIVLNKRLSYSPDCVKKMLFHRIIKLAWKYDILILVGFFKVFENPIPSYSRYPLWS